MKYPIVPSRKDTELELLEEEAGNVDGKGIVQALIAALDLQVDQYVHQCSWHT